MREFRTKQHDISRRKLPNVVTNESRTFTRSEYGQLHLAVVMPVHAFSRDALDPIRCQHGFHLAKISCPAKHAERMSARETDLFAVALHGTLRGDLACHLQPN